MGRRRLPGRSVDRLHDQFAKGVRKKENGMLWILGLFTLGALIWLLAGMMATESDAERRRPSARPSAGKEATSQSGSRRAA